jgi:hypothetical protein
MTLQLSPDIWYIMYFGALQLQKNVLFRYLEKVKFQYFRAVWQNILQRLAKPVKNLSEKLTYLHHMGWNE